MVIWLVFNVVSGGLFLTPRNLWNLSVQSASVAIMATGMVLIIVSRNIDLSVGSILGFTGMFMALVQAEWIPQNLGLGFDQPYTWIIAVLVGVTLGALIGGLQGFLVAYVGIPSFIVTLGGLLVWRGLTFQLAPGQTIAPLDATFQLLGGGPKGSARRHGQLGPRDRSRASASSTASSPAGGGDTISGSRCGRCGRTCTIGVLGCAAVIAAVWVANSYSWPEELAKQYAADHGIAAPPGGLQIPTGIANPVLIGIGVAIVMTILATRRRFGRYVFAIGGNPEAAELGGINTRRTIMMTFVIMGVLAALSAAVQTARLNAAMTGLGTQAELAVIAAAVIGGTSFAGGIGTIPGAVLGAVVMQSLQSGMVLLKVDTPIQDVVVGVVLVTAVGLDTIARRRAR